MLSQLQSYMANPTNRQARAMGPGNPGGSLLFRLVLCSRGSIKLGAELDQGAALASPVPIGVTQGINTAAIFLLIKLLALADFYHARRAAALSPVVIPIGQPVIASRGAAAAIVDLLHVLPARDAEGTRHHGKAILERV